MKKILSTALIAGSLLLTQASQAITFDFLAEGNATEKGYSAFLMTESGVTVTATATELNGDGIYSAYLDGGDAGLGVCKVLTSSDQCAPSSDDNVTVTELLHLAFDEIVSITEINFLNGAHGTDFANNQFNVRIDDAATYSTYSLSSQFLTVLSGQKFSFWLDDQSNAVNQNQFYISSVTVPAPGTLMLLSLGLLGLFGSTKKRSVS